MTGKGGSAMPLLRSNACFWKAWQLSEINALKQKLAKENVFCPVQTIQRAILMPEEAPPKALLEGRFPVPGVGLLVNPFAEKKKKKKKKKKKGKKRAK